MKQATDETLTPEYYTMDELRAFGCPNELLMQYVLCTKKELDDLMKGLK